MDRIKRKEEEGGDEIYSAGDGGEKGRRREDEG